MSTFLTSAPVLLEPSVATAGSALLPSEPGTVQLAVKGEVASVEMRFHEPVEQAALAFEHSKKPTEATSVSGEVALIETLAGSAAFTYCGDVSVTVGAWLSTR